MDERNIVLDAISLHSKENPTGHRILTLMTAQKGLLDVFIFGGAKSSLRSISAPFAFGKAFIYYDPVKDYNKLSDFQPVSCFPSLREAYLQLLSATFLAELLIKIKGGGGDYSIIFYLTKDCLDLIDSPPLINTALGQKEYVLYSIIIFIWKLAIIQGIRPNCEHCSNCNTQFVVHQDCAYWPDSACFVCLSCASSKRASSLPVSSRSLAWLKKLSFLELVQGVAQAPKSILLPSLCEIVFSLAQNMAITRLSTLDLFQHYIQNGS